MWGLGFNASREVLLAIRQANQQRVEHLIGGLTAALRQQRESRSDEIGSSLWDFACAVQRLSSLPLGSEKDAFWDEVVHVALQRDRPFQAAQLLESFTRLQHNHDAILSRHIFNFAQETLWRWDASAVTALCMALAGSKRAARHPLETMETPQGANAWGRFAGRCVEVLPTAQPWQLAQLARCLGIVGAPKAQVAPFYDALEERLCFSPHLNELFTVADLIGLMSGLARQRSPLRPSQSMKDALTRWPLEEYVGRQVQHFDPPSRCVALNASMRLRRGGDTLFELLAEPLPYSELETEQVALLFSAAAAAAPVIGLSPALQMLRRVLPRCRALASSLRPWQLAYIAQALDVLGELRGKDRGPLLWSDMTEASELLEELCQRTEEARSCWSVPAWSLKSQIHIHPFDSFFNCKERCDFFTACCAS
ncbi:Uncharacterized protein SCF082_LOCUS51292 [Durusdinium trenchii]|uniref:Uncharacterized protein n=1 Tax=Durusdinium trenchii TaxID=1381693 RepID=A0ABP0SDK9_9DINO